MSYQEVTLDSLADGKGAFVDGPFGSRLKASEYVDAGVPVLRLQNIRTNQYDGDNLRFITNSKADELSRHDYKPGDVVIAKLGDPCGVACQIPKSSNSGIIVADVVRFRGRKNEIDHKYLTYYLNSPQCLRQTSQMSKGTTRQRINLSDIKKLLVPLPPLPEQRRIAAILDKADAIRKKRQETIHLTEEFLRSAFLEMFGDPVTNPKGWPVKRMDEVASVNRGKFTPRPRNDPKYYGGKHPFIQTGDLSHCHGVLKQWKQTLNDEGAKVSRQFNKGTIAIAIAANIGDTAILGFDSYFPDSVVGIEVLNERATSEYVECVLRFQQQSLTFHATETAQKNINLQTLRPLRIPVPPLEYQFVFSNLYIRSYALYDTQMTVVVQKDNLFGTLINSAFLRQI